eukprot:TRINITY_DN3310_c0_g1_i1.p1 TRINITY_DN3310_c0_g1~~TRINITY_DN3310_c0_g1_i1.p1  ORF type:complete len:393 (+),score=76.47 TRINITY_DN3310_c0_g1_i1:421-1599(+)
MLGSARTRVGALFSSTRSTTSLFGPKATRGGCSGVSLSRTAPASLLAKHQRCLSAAPLKHKSLGEHKEQKDQPLIDRPPRILITGSLGQIGTELTYILRKRFGVDSIVTSDVRRPTPAFRESGPFVFADVLDKRSIARLVVEHDIDWIVHFASLLSAVGEMKPELALQVNIDGFRNVIDVARQNKLRVFAPSSIAAFGSSAPKFPSTPDVTIQRPTTVYGITKVFVEHLGEYYHLKEGLDFRSLRYPGIISSETDPGGGTTDYAVAVFKEALLHGKYECFIEPDTPLPMMYMPDCLKATEDLLCAPQEVLKRRTYNVNAMSFTPEDLFKSIRRHIPDLKISYNTDFRQQIAESWPNALDDTNARNDWEWNPKYDIDTMVDDMMTKTRSKLRL